MKPILSDMALLNVPDLFGLVSRIHFVMQRRRCRCRNARQIQHQPSLRRWTHRNIAHRRKNAVISARCLTLIPPTSTNPRPAPMPPSRTAPPAISASRNVSAHSFLPAPPAHRPNPAKAATAPQSYAHERPSSPATATTTPPTTTAKPKPIRASTRPNTPPRYP